MDIRKKTDMQNAMIFMGAVIISAFFVNLLLKQDRDLGYLNLSVYDIGSTGMLEFSAAALIFLKRIKQFIIIYAVMRLLRADVISYLIIALLGAAYGALSSIQVYYDGFSGIVLLMLYVLPHYIFYILLIIKTAHFIKYGSGEHRYLKYFALALLVLCAGALTECTVSRFFLTHFYQYMGQF